MTTKSESVKTNKELATALRVSVRTIERHVKDGLPTKKNGTFDVAICRSWSRRRLSKAKSRSRRGISASDIDDLGDDDAREFEEIDHLKGNDLDEASIRAATKFRLVRTSREKILVRKAAGEVIERTEVESHRGKVMAAMSRRFNSVGRRIGPDLDPENPLRAQLIVDQAVREILEDFAVKKDHPE